jgi:mono/diheme cytochrome c family protein
MVRKSIFFLILAAVLLAACGSSGGDNSAPEAPTLNEQETRGQQLFSQYCAACHSTIGDAVIVGPAMAGVATRAETRVAGLSAHEYMVESILDPSAYLVPGFDDLMPKTWGKTLTGEEMDALVAFMLTLH